MMKLNRGDTDEEIQNQKRQPIILYGVYDNSYFYYGRLYLGGIRNVSWYVEMGDIVFANGVSLFEEPKSGIRGNFYEPIISGTVDEIEMLADTYYFNFGPESRKFLIYYSKLTYKQRRAYAEDKMREIEEKKGR